MRRSVFHCAPRGLFAVLMLGALALFAAAKPAAADFPDVSSDYWAWPWIDALIMKGITTGYPDGTFQPSVQVTRDQMAVFLARVLEAEEPTREVAWVAREEAPGSGYFVYAPTRIGAEAYRLYSSTNGADFTDWTTELPFVFVNPRFVRWYIQSGPMTAADTYVKPVAVIGDHEFQLCQLLDVRTQGALTPITITSPAGNATPREPLLEWQSVPKAVLYRVQVIGVYPLPERDSGYNALVEGWRASIRFNQAAGPGVLFGNVADPAHRLPLESNTDYVVNVWGIDAGGFAFAFGQQAFHTTP